MFKPVQHDPELLLIGKKLPDNVFIANIVMILDIESRETLVQVRKHLVPDLLAVWAPRLEEIVDDHRQRLLSAYATASANQRKKD